MKWRKETGRDCKIIFTAHDYQLVCPNHMLNNPNTHQNCEKCLGGHFVNCMKGKCIHGSTAKSAIGMMEAEFWKWKGTYKYIDTMICCSEFMKSKMDSNPLFATKTVAMHNFIDKVEWKETPKKNYVLYFGRFSEEKGIGTLITNYGSLLQALATQVTIEKLGYECEIVNYIRKDESYKNHEKTLLKRKTKWNRSPAWLVLF